MSLLLLHLVGIVLCLKPHPVDCDVTPTLTPSPCNVTRDGIYGGLSVNCEHRSITSLSFLQHRIPTRTFTCSLAFNSLTRLSRDSLRVLRHVTKLRVLDFSSNRISSVGPFTFSRFALLERLNLRHNRINLDGRSSSESMFHGLHNLQLLELGYNGNEKRRGSFADLFFKDLQKLKTLTLDTFQEDVLKFGSLFRRTHLLASLTLTGGLGSFTNSSFETLEATKLEQFIIPPTFQIQRVESGAFRYLRYLHWFDISSHLELSDILQSLAPFAHRNFSRLSIVRYGFKYRRLTVKVFSRNNVLTRHMARYLSTMCVKNFVWQKYLVSMIEFSVLTNPTWRRCLKTLDMSGNPIIGETIELLRILSMPHLEQFIAIGYKYYHIRVGELVVWKPPSCLNKRCSRKICIKENTINEMNQFNLVDDSGVSDLMRYDRNIRTRNTSSSIQTRRRSIRRKTRETLSFRVTNSLKRLVLDFWENAMLKVDKNSYILGARRLREMHMAGNGIFKFTGHVAGLNNLQVLDLSKNDGSKMTATFFDALSTLVHLNIANMQLDSEFMAGSSERLFRNLSRLVTLDLSNNNLRFLEDGTFDVNLELSVLILAGNRFESIPLNLQTHSKVCVLDMRYNLLSKISDHETIMLEDHYMKSNNSLSLFLSGNVFFCGCMNIRFLSWLRRTRTIVDNDRNYSCILDSGVRTNILEIQDLEAMWRMCIGQKAFWISVVWMCILIFCFLGHILVSRFKTQIRIYLLKLFSSRFMMKGPMEYPIGVYIGYADSDTHLACRRLRPFIEDKLHLSTYVRHRDLLPASDMAESIMEAVHSSWRVLLLISNGFLNDPWSYYLLKVSSTYAVQLENPRRLVLILTDGNDKESLLTKLPSCVVRAVRQENIVTMTSRGNISYEDKQALKTALCHKNYRL